MPDAVLSREETENPEILLAEAWYSVRTAALAPTPPPTRRSGCKMGCRNDEGASGGSR